MVNIGGQRAEGQYKRDNRPTILEILMINDSLNPSILKRITEDTYILLFTEPVTGILEFIWETVSYNISLTK